MILIIFKHPKNEKNLMYVELCNNGLKHDGPAWIGYGFFSKSKCTKYFNGKSLKKYTYTSYVGNHYDIETGQEYWISGVKKDGKNRHIHRGGKIFVDKSAVFELMQKLGVYSLKKIGTKWLN